jgi:hypothetical protein
MSESERMVRQLEPTAREHWKQGEMPVCEIITERESSLALRAMFPRDRCRKRLMPPGKTPHGESWASELATVLK